MKFALKTAAVLAALGFFFAGSAAADSPKRYSLSFTSVTTIGSHQFEPGEYALLVHGHDSKVLVSDHDGNEVPLEAKLETGDQKWGATAVLINTSDGSRRVTEIRLGGSKTKVALN